MATWAELRTYIQRNYHVDTDRGEYLRLLLEVNQSRTQFVYIRFTQNTIGNDWVQIESPIGELNKVNVVNLLRQVETTVCGALSLVGDMVTLRHAVPLDDMNVEEFELPLWSISATADGLEETTSLQDSY